MNNFILSAFADEIDPQLSTQMDVLDRFGIKHIEMRGVNGKNLTLYSLEEAREIKKQLDRRCFKISAVGSPIGKIKITEAFDPHLELFRHTIKIAKILDTKYIRMFSFYIPKGEAPEKYREEVINRLKQFIDAADGSGLTLLHENEKDIYGDTPERCLDLFETINCSYFKAVFDPANFVQCDIKTYPRAYNLLKSHIAYIHIKDALFKNHRVVPAGYGDGKVKEILTELYKSGFEGFLSLEPHLANFVGFADLELNDKDERNSGMVSLQAAKMESESQKKFAIAVSALNRILSVIEE